MMWQLTQWSIQVYHTQSSWWDHFQPSPAFQILWLSNPCEICAYLNFRHRNFSVSGSGMVGMPHTASCYHRRWRINNMRSWLCTTQQPKYICVKQWHALLATCMSTHTVLLHSTCNPSNIDFTSHLMVGHPPTSFLFLAWLSNILRKAKFVDSF